MDKEFLDLLPLFLAETRDRLERLQTLLPGWREGDAAVELRRELHTIKGAARMLQLAPVADLAHGAENLLQDGAATDAPTLTAAIDELSAVVEAIAQGEDPAVRDAAPATHAPLEGRAMSMLRVEAGLFDTLTDRATRLRILSLTVGELIHELGDLAKIAEKGGDEEHAREVLPMLGAALRRIGANFERTQRRLYRSTDAQLDALLDLQMQPLRGFLLSLARHGRELARSLGREVVVTLEGEDTRLDRRIAGELEEALLHLVRNAVDHGIEPAEERSALKKPRQGTMSIRASAEGNRVRLSVTDDGRGIDTDVIIAKAIERGLLDAGTATSLGRDEALRLIFAPGFSTRESISDVSGRGAGMDVVATAVASVGGVITLEATAGKGCTVTIDVPLARRGEHIMVVRIGSLRLGIPATGVKRLSWLRRDSVVEREGRLLAREQDRLIPFVSLNRVFGEDAAEGQILVHTTVGGQSLAIAVDAFEREEEVLLRPVPVAATASTLLDGITLLSSGEPVGVISLARLPQSSAQPATAARGMPARLRSVKVLLVEDSLVTREMERRLLEDAGFDVTAATDATEALTFLGESDFDCVVTDVEMPGMDGYELTRQLRQIPHLAQLPVVVVSTRDRPEDRISGLSAGADAYLTKQGLDASELIALVRRLGGNR